MSIGAPGPFARQLFRITLWGLMAALLAAACGADALDHQQAANSLIPPGAEVVYRNYSGIGCAAVDAEDCDQLAWYHVAWTRDAVPQEQRFEEVDSRAEEQGWGAGRVSTLSRGHLHATYVRGEHELTVVIAPDRLITRCAGLPEVSEADLAQWCDSVLVH